MYIPSNFTLEETLDYLPDSPELNVIRDKICSVTGLLEKYEEELTAKIQETELIEEQSYFREVLLDKILDLCRHPAGTKKDMIKTIKLMYEESQVEL